jgi:hypothetical protein
MPRLHDARRHVMSCGLSKSGRLPRWQGIAQLWSEGASLLFWKWKAKEKNDKQTTVPAERHGRFCIGKNSNTTNKIRNFTCGRIPSGTNIASTSKRFPSRKTLLPASTPGGTSLVNPCDHAFARNVQRKFFSLVFAAS